jgi:hypothetical protein
MNLKKVILIVIALIALVSSSSFAQEAVQRMSENQWSPHAITYLRQEVDRQDRLVQRARVLISEGRQVDAIALLEPELPVALFGLAYTHYSAYRGERQFSRYINVASPVADAGSNFVAYFVGSAYASLGLSDFKKVEKYFLLSANTGFGLAQERLAELYYTGGTTGDLLNMHAIPPNFTSALNFFEMCTEDDDLALQCKRGKAFSLLKKGEATKAIQILELSKEYWSLWSVYYFGLGVRVDKALAETYRSKMVSSVNKNEPCSFRSQDLISDFLAGKSSSKALMALQFNGSFTCFPADIDTYVSVGLESIDAGRTDLADKIAELLENGTKIAPDYGTAYFVRLIASVSDKQYRDMHLRALQRLENKLSPTAREAAQKRYQEWKKKNSS